MLCASGEESGGESGGERQRRSRGGGALLSLLCALEGSRRCEGSRRGNPVNKSEHPLCYQLSPAAGRWQRATVPPVPEPVPLPVPLPVPVGHCQPRGKQAVQAAQHVGTCAQACAQAHEWAEHRQTACRLPQCAHCPPTSAVALTAPADSPSSPYAWVLQPNKLHHWLALGEWLQESSRAPWLAARWQV